MSILPISYALGKGWPILTGQQVLVVPLVISGSPTAATVGDTTVFTPTISGGSGTYVSLAVLSGVLPGGRSISGLTVSGTYTAAGAFSYTLRVTDSLGATADLAVSSTVAAATTVTALPRTANMIMKFLTEDMPVVADGTAAASWTDSFGNTVSQATGSKQPLYKVNRQNGFPSLLFSGAQQINGDIATLATALNAKEGTVIIVGKNIATQTTNGLLCTTSASGNGWALAANGTAAGARPNGARIPYSGTGLTTVGQAFYANYFGSGNYHFTFVNGSSIGWQTGATAGSTASFAVGGQSNDFGFSKFECFAIYAWDVGLTPVEYMQAEKHIREKYADAKPWEVAGKFRILAGDSITAGQGAATQGGSYPYQLATAMGWPLGTWHNLGRFGSTMSAVANQASNFVGLSAITGVPTNVMIGEFKNQDGQTLSNQVAAYQAFVAQCQTTGITDIRFWTATDYANRVAGKATYCAYWDVPANRTGLMTTYAPIHTDSFIGVDGSSPDAAPFTPYYADTVGHMLDAGYAKMASFLATYAVGM